MGCHMRQKCYTNNCSWAIATRRLETDEATDRLVNLLRGVGLDQVELDVLGIKPAGR